MCGIVALYAYADSAPLVDRDELFAIRDQMQRRGPDGAGAWFSDDGRVSLGHRRLSIIDLSESGAQPMGNEDGTLRLTFNGEIYNYRTLRDGLVRRGHVFSSHTDTEVILHLYEEEGPSLVQRLRGMFAFALWDGRRRCMLLARDPYGIKPLYYCVAGGVLRAASQVKALLAGGQVSREVDPAGLVGLHLWGSVPEPHTLFRGLHCLGPGATLLVDAQGPGPVQRTFRPAQVYIDSHEKPYISKIHKLSEKEAGDAVRDALVSSLRCHLESDVPVGLFLSAGLDSNVLLSLLCELAPGQVRTVTLAFEAFRGTPRDESPLAEHMARRLGAEHRTVYLGPRDFEALLPAFMAAMDQPTIDGLNSFLVSKAAADCGLKVALSGLGGDELFGGYPSFRHLPLWAGPATLPLRSRLIRRLLEPLGLRLPLPGPKAKLRGLLRFPPGLASGYVLQRGLFMPWELPGLLPPEVLSEGLLACEPLAFVTLRLPPPRAGTFAAVAVLEQSLYMHNQLLRDSDWAGMAHSLEIRLPLVDRVLYEAVGPIAAGSFDPRRKPAKWLLAQAARPPLSRTQLRRPKTGFGVPMQAWLRQTLGDRLGHEAWPRGWARYCAAQALGSASHELMLEA